MIYRITDNMPSISANIRPVVIFVIFPDAKLLDVAGPMQVFNDVRLYGGQEYELVLVSVDGGELLTDAGVKLATEPIDKWRDRPIHTLLIVGGIGAFAAAQNAKLVVKTTDLARRAKRVGSVCTGAFILAAAGFLDGRKAVTHWLFCRDLADKHPTVSVEPDRIFINDDGIWTSAGVTAGIDMALAMVAEDSGRKTALGVARSLVAFMARPGGQSQFSKILDSQTEDASGRFDALHDWIASNLDQDLRVANMAAQTGMSVRNFARIYRSVTGYSPAKAVERFRVAAARDLLEETDLPISVIARKTGFDDDERLRRAMQRVLKMSPKQCRERFGVDM